MPLPTSLWRIKCNVIGKMCSCSCVCFRGKLCALRNENNKNILSQFSCIEAIQRSDSPFYYPHNKVFTFKPDDNKKSIQFSFLRSTFPFIYLTNSLNLDIDVIWMFDSISSSSQSYSHRAESAEWEIFVNFHTNFTGFCFRNQMIGVFCR